MGKRKEQVKLEEVGELNGNAKRPRRSAANKVVENDLIDENVEEPEEVNGNAKRPRRSAAKKVVEKESDVDDPEPIAKEEGSDEEDEAGDDEDEEKFEVDCLVADRIAEDGKTQYKVRWIGYESEDDTWENESNLDCEEIIEEYLESKATNGKKKNTRTKTATKKNKPTNGEPSENGEKVPDKIVGLHTLKNGTRELLVRWKNLPESSDTWEPEEKFRGTEVHDIFLVKEKENRAKKAAKAEKGTADEPEEEEEEEAEEDEEEEGGEDEE